jgi:hypothetical protein
LPWSPLWGTSLAADDGGGEARKITPKKQLDLPALAELISPL